MGSGSTRKPSDRVVIPRPKITSTVSHGGGEGGGRRSSSEICRLSFSVKLKSIVKVSENDPLSLRSSGERLGVFIGTDQLATLPKTLSEEISGCTKSGFKYLGRARIIKNEPFGFFKRS